MAARLLALSLEYRPNEFGANCVLPVCCKMKHPKSAGLALHRLL
jgi:hypothetical protein